MVMALIAYSGLPLVWELELEISWENDTHMEFQCFRFQQGRETTSMTFLLVFGNLHFRSKPETGSLVLAKQEKGID